MRSFMAVILFILGGGAWPTSPAVGADIRQRDSLTGDWGGLRAEWQRRGIHAEGSYIGDVFANLDGGRREDTEYLDALDLRLLLDMTKLAGWSSGNVLIHGLYNNGGSISDAVGDIQGVNNIEATSGFSLYEAWVQRSFLTNRLSLLAGVYDINSEFDVIHSADLFLHSSPGLGAELAASGLVGPSTYPLTALSVRVKTLLAPSLYVQAVVSDGVPGDPANADDHSVMLRGAEGAFLAGEIGWYRLADDTRGVAAGDEDMRDRRQHIGRETPADYRLKLALGIWRYTSDFARLRSALGKPPTSEHDNGIYLLLDWQAWRETRDSAQGLAGFLRLGHADNDASRFDFYAGTGLVYTGLIPGRDSDEIGLAVAVARNSDYTKSVSAQALENTETAVELTYRAELTPWLALQPDLQYIVNPGTDPGLRNAWVAGARLEFNL